ncbi:MAG: sigma-70 family RNA polymerase sigma factor [Bacteroidota bacterium]
MVKRRNKYTDLELFLALKKSKAEAEMAFAEIYARYSHRVFAYCHKVSSTPQDAQDLFQDTFTKFFSSAQTRNTIGNMFGFILKISRNIHLNQKRDKKIFVNIDSLEIANAESDPKRLELKEVLTLSLEMLEFEYREVFVLRHYQGLSYTEIADITGLSIPTLKNRYWRAKEMLRTALTPYFDNMSN